MSLQAARYAQSGGGVPGASAGNSAGAAGAGGAAAAGAGGAAAAGGGLGEPPPEDADAADVAAQVRRQRERFYAAAGEFHEMLSTSLNLSENDG